MEVGGFWRRHEAIGGAARNVEGHASKDDQNQERSFLLFMENIHLFKRLILALFLSVCSGDALYHAIPVTHVSSRQTFT